MKYVVLILVLFCSVAANAKEKYEECFCNGVIGPGANSCYNVPVTKCYPSSKARVEWMKANRFDSAYICMRNKYQVCIDPRR